MKKKNIAALYAISAAALYAINVPLSKILLNYVEPTMMASFLYLGAGFGLCIYGWFQNKIGRNEKKEPLTKKELPYTAAMVVLDIAAPILLMLGISMSDSSSVSLLNNFEIAVTSIIALIIFKEVISKKLWIAIILVTIASLVLSIEDMGSFAFHPGALLVLGACLCWGFENNCTRMISNKSSVEIVVIKGTFSGLGSFIVALIAGESIPAIQWIICVLALGFVSYGLSIHFYIMAQKDLGAAKTSAYYAVAPFLGVAFSMLLLQERPGIPFYAALIIMIISTGFLVKDTIEMQHTHEHAHTHIHEHRHGDLVHTHEHTHVHTHMHIHSGDSEKHIHEHEISDHNHLHAV
ncbi:MAG: DMT family transporter [Faecousia sp.]